MQVGSVEIDLGRKSAYLGRKRKMTIEAVLAWAYGRELPKARAGGATMVATTAWSAISRYAELLTLIDATPNQFGCIPDFIEADAPHSDALLVAAAVTGLGDVAFEPGDDLISDIAGITPIERAECNARGFLAASSRAGHLPGLVIRHAMIGRAPRWESHGAMTRSLEVGPRGGPVWRRRVMRAGGFSLPAVAVEIDGFDPRTRRPHPEAWRKSVLSPDPALLVSERVDYQAYVGALGLLAADLDGRLGTIAVEATALPFWPWEGEVARAGARVLFARKAAGSKLTGA